jgi:hypothetical protein
VRLVVVDGDSDPRPLVAETPLTVVERLTLFEPATPDAETPEATTASPGLALPAVEVKAEPDKDRVKASASAPIPAEADTPDSPTVTSAVGGDAANGFIEPDLSAGKLITSH